MLAHATPQHGRRHVPIPALLLRLMQNVQHNSLFPGQPVADVRQFIEALSHGKKSSIRVLPSLGLAVASVQAAP